MVWPFSKREYITPESLERRIEEHKRKEAFWDSIHKIYHRELVARPGFPRRSSIQSELLEALQKASSPEEEQEVMDHFTRRVMAGGIKKAEAQARVISWVLPTVGEEEPFPEIDYEEED